MLLCNDHRCIPRPPAHSESNVPRRSLPGSACLPRTHTVGTRVADYWSLGKYPAGPDQEQGGSVADETYSGDFYCVKCKEKREAEGNVVVNAKGTRMAKAKCPVCGTNLNRILGRA